MRKLRSVLSERVRFHGCLCLSNVLRQENAGRKELKRTVWCSPGDWRQNEKKLPPSLLLPPLGKGTSRKSLGIIPCPRFTPEGFQEAQCNLYIFYEGKPYFLTSSCNFQGTNHSCCMRYWQWLRIKWLQVQRISFGDCSVAGFMPVWITRKLMINLGSFPITNILLLQHGSTSTGINLCRKNYNVLHITENEGKRQGQQKKSFLQCKMIQNKIDIKCST